MTLRDLAISRLCALFPRDFHRMMDRLNADRPDANTRCIVRACPFPATVDGLCRSHFADSHAEFSMMRSATGVAVSGLGYVA
jgi:hypothetical protein